MAEAAVPRRGVGAPAGFEWREGVDGSFILCRLAEPRWTDGEAGGRGALRVRQCARGGLEAVPALLP